MKNRINIENLKLNELIDYNPNENVIIDLIMLVYNHLPDYSSLALSKKYVRKIIIIDNNSNEKINEELKILIKKLGNEKATLIENKSNKGVSKAYNEVINNLQVDKKQMILILDHDAVFFDSLFEYLIGSIHHFINNKIGVIVPIVSDDATKLNDNTGIKELYSNIDSVITSGNPLLKVHYSSA